MSLNYNIFASYSSQIYVTLIGIIMVPLYIQYLGIEAYGLVGFFSMLQAWFLLLDIGLTPTVARETARFRGGATDALSYRRLVRTLEGIFLVVALVGGAAMFAASAYISHDWLQASRLAISEVQTAVQLMAIIVAMRWMCGLYRGMISGSERLAWLGGYNALIATLRFVGVLPILMFVGVTPTVFFGYQFGVAVIEFGSLLFFAYRLLPDVPEGKRLRWSWEPLRPVLKFSLTIAFTSSAWVVVTQTDKLVLSKILPLAEYGYFMLAVLVAGGVMMMSGPISSAILPRMSKLDAEGDHDGLIRVYQQATKIVAIIVLPLAFTLAAFSEQILWAWTGDHTVAHNAAPILCLYALGNGVLAISGFVYYLQYAKGNLRLHLIGSGLFLLLLIPSLILATLRFGGVGAGWAWLVSNLLYFFLWVPVVHRRFERGLHWRWLSGDVAVFAAVAGLLAWGFSTVAWIQNSRIHTALVLIAIGIIITVSTILSSKYFRKHVWRLLLLVARSRLRMFVRINNDHDK